MSKSSKNQKSKSPIDNSSQKRKESSSKFEDVFVSSILTVPVEEFGDTVIGAIEKKKKKLIEKYDTHENICNVILQKQDEGKPPKISELLAFANLYEKRKENPKNAVTDIHDDVTYKVIEETLEKIKEERKIELEKITKEIDTNHLLKLGQEAAVIGKLLKANNISSRCCLDCKSQIPFFSSLSAMIDHSCEGLDDYCVVCFFTKMNQICPQCKTSTCAKAKQHESNSENLLQPQTFDLVDVDLEPPSNTSEAFVDGFLE